MADFTFVDTLSLATSWRNAHPINLSRCWNGTPLRVAFRITALPDRTTLCHIDDIHITKGFVGIADVEGGKLKVEIDGRNVTVENPDGGMLQVFDIMGRQIRTSSNSIRLPAAGVYILRFGGHSQKR